MHDGMCLGQGLPQLDESGGLGNEGHGQARPEAGSAKPRPGEDASVAVAEREMSQTSPGKMQDTQDGDPRGRCPASAAVWFRAARNGQAWRVRGRGRVWATQRATATTARGMCEVCGWLGLDTVRAVVQPVKLCGFPRDAFSRQATQTQTHHQLPLHHHDHHHHPSTSPPPLPHP